MTDPHAATHILKKAAFTLLLLFCHSVSAQDEESSGANMVATDAGTMDAQDLAVDESQWVWLNSSDGKDLAFYLSEKSGTAHGGVLIIPDKGSHPAVAATINSLRHTLADHHWHTLALNISTLDAGHIQKVIAAGVAALNERGVFNIAILGEGQGAAYGLQYIAGLPPAAEGEFQQIRALVMLNADNRAEGLAGQPMAPLALVDMPVLDAWYANDYQQQQRARQRRSMAAAANALYQQARLPYITVYSADEDNRITKQIRGWLDSNIAGFMVDKNMDKGAAGAAN